MSAASSLSTSDSPAELRASVLDAAINLGFRNSMMHRWMFDPTTETDDSGEHANPGLISPSSSMSLTSQSTSEESSTSPYRIRPPGQSSSRNPKLDIIIEQASNRDSEDQHFLRSSLEDAPLKAASLLGLGSPTAVVPSSKEKKFRLRKTKGTEYESDGGYMSEGSKKAKKTSRWRRKDAADGYESDGRNLSEANSSKKSKDKNNIENSASPLSDPGAFLATVNASLLPQSPQPDGYVTDSATASTERGRSKKKEKSRTQLSSPISGDENSAPNMQPRKMSFFQRVARATSRDRDKDKERGRASPAPPPVPPLPSSLPIASRFARAGTPLGKLSASDATSPTAEPAVFAGTPVLSTTSSAIDICDAMSFSLNSPGSLLTPPADAPRSISSLDLSGAAKAEARPSNDLKNDKVPPSRLMQSPVVKEATEKAGDSAGTQRIEENGGKSKSHRNPLCPRSRSTSPTEKHVVDSAAAAKAKKKGKKEKLIPAGSGSVSSVESVMSKLTTASISSPNPHFAKDSRPTPSPLQIANALRAVSPTNRNQLSPNAPRAPSPSESFLFVDEYEEERRSPSPPNANDLVVPSSSFIVPSPALSPLPGSSSSPAPKPTLAARRSANVRAINPTIDITPTQSRAGSPVSPNEDEVKATRATVLAYYQIPPPSPPPTGPLPPPPPDSEDPRSPDDRQFLSPTRPFGNGRSLSPLRNLSPGSPQGAYSPTRSPSPGLFAQPIPSVRRGRESPFPARPILPPEDGRSLITRVARYKNLHVDQRAEGSAEDGYDDEDADGEDAQRSSDEVFDTHTSTYIRDARARGEKRVYFTESTMVEKDSLANALLEAEDGAEEDDRSFYADEFDADNRRSVTDMSMYSRFSVLDADRSAQLRNGFVRRVEELYEADKARQGQEKWDDIPDVPELPAALRDAAPGKGILKASSPYKF